MYSRNQKSEHNVITVQKYSKTTVCTTHVLHKTTNATTQNYRPYYTKLCYTTDKLPVHVTDTNQVSFTQIRHNDVATYNLYMKLT